MFGHGARKNQLPCHTDWPEWGVTMGVASLKKACEILWKGCTSGKDDH